MRPPLRVPRLVAASTLALLAVLLTALVVSADSVRVGAEAEVVADDGANLRAEPGTLSDLVEVVPVGRRVFVREGPSTTETGDWYRVEYEGDVGWIRADGLESARAGELASRGAEGVDRARDDAPRATVPVGAEMTVESDAPVNLRAEPGTLSDVIGTIAPARVVFVRTGPETTETGDWYKVDYDGSIGWVRADTLASRGRSGASAPSRAASAPAAPRAASAPAAPAPAAPSSGGQAIAAKALQYVGYPYVWGGSGPGGFDCSGLVYYVMARYGIWLGRTADAQAGAGRHVAYGDLQPGDIVIFANTFGGGYSHDGIYVGGGRFVHAEDYGVGVRVSSLSGYWGAHYAGARRVW